MATLVISGNKGYGPHTVSGFDIYDATNASVRVNNDPNFSGGQTGFRVTSSPGNALWLGGTILSDNNPNQEWTFVHSKDGPGMHLANSNRITIKRLKMTDTFDGINVTNCEHAVVDTCWYVRYRDDGIEADNRGEMKGVTLIRSRHEQGSGHIISSRRGNSAVGEPPPVYWNVIDNIFEISPIFRDSREKRMYPWAGAVGHRNLWKDEGAGVTTLLLKNNVFKMEALAKTPKGSHSLIEGQIIHPQSGGNVLVWVGPQTAIGGIPTTTVNRIGGGTFQIPESIIGTGDTRTKILSLFTFTDNISVWNTALNNWVTNVWGGTPAASPPVAVNDTGYNLQAGNKTISIPVLANDSNVDSSVNPGVSKVGGPSGPVTTIVSGKTLEVTSHATNTGAWSQAYRVTTSHGQSDASASGTVTAAPVDPPPTSGLQIRPHQSAWQMAEGGILVSELVITDTTVRQGILSKDASGFADGHLAFFVTANGLLQVRHQLLPNVNLFLQMPAESLKFQETEILFTFGSTGTKLYVDRVLREEQNTAWNLVSNTEPLIVGADSSHSVPGGIDTRDPFLGSWGDVEFLTSSEVTALLGTTGPGPVTPDQSAIDSSIPGPKGPVPKEKLRANIAAAKSELISLGATGTGSINPALPADFVAPAQSDMRVNFAAIRSSLQSIGANVSGISTAIPADNAHASRSAVRANFNAIRTALNSKLAVSNLRPSLGAPLVLAFNSATDRAVNMVCPYPESDLQAGNLILAVVGVHDSGNAGSCATPSGWTSVTSGSSTSLFGQVFRKFAAGTETGASQEFNWDSSNAAGDVGFVAMWHFRDVHQTTPVQNISTPVSGNLTNPALPTITTTAAHCLAIAVQVYSDNPSTAPTVNSGTTGGTWVYGGHFGTVNGDDGGFAVFTAEMPAAGTISGGSVSVPTTTPTRSISMTFGFALRGPS